MYVDQHQTVPLNDKNDVEASDLDILDVLLVRQVKAAQHPLVLEYETEWI